MLRYTLPYPGEISLGIHMKGIVMDRVESDGINPTISDRPCNAHLFRLKQQ